MPSQCQDLKWEYFNIESRIRAEPEVKRQQRQTDPEVNELGFCDVSEVGTGWMDKQEQVRALPGQGSAEAAQHIKPGFLTDEFLTAINHNNDILTSFRGEADTLSCVTLKETTIRPYSLHGSL